MQQDNYVVVSASSYKKDCAAAVSYGKMEALKLTICCPKHGSGVKNKQALRVIVSNTQGVFVLQ